MSRLAVLPNLQWMRGAGLSLRRFLFFGLLASGLVACDLEDPYRLYAFDLYCSETSWVKLDTCQPCNYMGPRREFQIVEFVDSASGNTVAAQVLARPTFYESHREEQKQQCYYKALQIGGAGSKVKLEVSADAKEGYFVVILNEDRYQISKKDLSYGYRLLPPTQDSTFYYNFIPPRKRHPEALLREAWLGAGLGLARLRYQEPGGRMVTLTKKYGN